MQERYLFLFYILYNRQGSQSKAEWNEFGIDGPNFGKDAQFTEFGEVPLERTAKATAKAKEMWEDTRDKAAAGDTDNISAEHYIRYYSTIKKIGQDVRNRTIPNDLEWLSGNPPNEWIYGPTGTGIFHTRLPALALF